MKASRISAGTTMLFGAVLFLTFGCGRAVSELPSLPQSPADRPIDLNAQAGGQGSNHSLWGYYIISIDKTDLSATVIPVRSVTNHWNSLAFLEQSPCTDCLWLTVVEWKQGESLKANVTIKQPFTHPAQTAFDVRGIAMFKGSLLFPTSNLTLSDWAYGEGELINADGYTTLYNPSTAGHDTEGYLDGNLATDTLPDATLNGYKRFISVWAANDRNAFYASDQLSVQYQIDPPDTPGSWVFGCAVNACWAMPVNLPVEDLDDFRC